jgi:hypothetical protein
LPSSSCFFFVQLSSPLSSILPMMKLSNFRNNLECADDQELVRNLASHYLHDLLCYVALMLQVHDQMMIDMFLRPLLLLLLVFWFMARWHKRV